MAIDFPSSPSTNDIHTSGGLTWRFDGESWVSLPYVPITLGTDTTGDYVQSLVAGTGVTLTNNSGEGATPTIAIGQAIGSSDSPTFTNLTVNGDLTVSGTTTTVNSTTITVDDPVITVGGDTAPESDDNKDRGVEFRWHNGTSAKTGFFGYDDSTGRFTFIPDATNTSEVFSGTVGDLQVGGVYATSGTFTSSLSLPADTSLPERYTSLTANTTLNATTHKNYVIEVNSTSALTMTIPPASTSDFPVGAVITFVRVNTGEVTIAAGSGVTINTPIGYRLRSQWSTATLRKRSTDTWLLSGDIKV